MKKMIKAGILVIFLVIAIWYIDSKRFKLGKEIIINNPPESYIVRQGNYTLDCKTTNYTSIQIGDKIIFKNTYAKISKGSERDTLYISGNTAKFFGADYAVIQDNGVHLIMVRQYPPSGLTETVSINKTTGIGFDTKTLTSGISGGPNTDTYILSCVEI